MDYIYTIYDNVTGELNAVMKAKNDKDCIRMLVFTGYFKVNRESDTDIYNTGLYAVEAGGVVNDKNIETPYKLDVKKIAEELSVKMENKAEKIEGTKDEVLEKIDKKTKKE